MSKTDVGSTSGGRTLSSRSLVKGLAVDTRANTLNTPIRNESDNFPVLDDIRLDVLKANNIRMVIFDFDNCVMSIHTSALRITAEQVSSRPWKRDFNQFDFFVRLIIELCSNGFKVCICSYGVYEVIQQYLDEAFFSIGSTYRFFSRENILTPSSIGQKDSVRLRQGKPELFKVIAERFGVKHDQMMFFDDDRSNIEVSIEHGTPVSIYCPDGFSTRAWIRALEIVQSGRPAELAKQYLSKLEFVDESYAPYFPSSGAYMSSPALLSPVVNQSSDIFGSSASKNTLKNHPN